MTADQGGDLPPMLGIGAALTRRGWTVIVHGDSAAVRAWGHEQGYKFTFISVLYYCSSGLNKVISSK